MVRWRRPPEWFCRRRHRQLLRCRGLLWRGPKRVFRHDHELLPPQRGQDLAVPPHCGATGFLPNHQRQRRVSRRLCRLGGVLRHRMHRRVGVQLQRERHRRRRFLRLHRGRMWRMRRQQRILRGVHELRVVQLRPLCHGGRRILHRGRRQPHPHVVDRQLPWRNHLERGRRQRQHHGRGRSIQRPTDHLRRRTLRGRRMF